MKRRGGVRTPRACDRQSLCFFKNFLFIRPGIICAEHMASLFQSSQRVIELICKLARVLNVELKVSDY